MYKPRLRVLFPQLQYSRVYVQRGIPLPGTLARVPRGARRGPDLFFWTSSGRKSAGRVPLRTSCKRSWDSSPTTHAFCTYDVSQVVVLFVSTREEVRLLRLTCRYHGVVAGGPGTRCSAVCVVWLAHWLRGWLMPCWLDSCKLHVTTHSNMKPTRRGDATLRESGLTLRL